MYYEYGFERVAQVAHTIARRLNSLHLDIQYLGLKYVIIIFEKTFSMFLI